MVTTFQKVPRAGYAAQELDLKIYFGSGTWTQGLVNATSMLYPIDGSLSTFGERAYVAKASFDFTKQLTVFVILLPQPPEQLRLQACATNLSLDLIKQLCIGSFCSIEPQYTE